MYFVLQIAMIKKHMNKINPDVLEMIKLGNGIGGTIIGGQEKGSVRRDLISAIKAAKERTKPKEG